MGNFQKAITFWQNRSNPNKEYSGSTIRDLNQILSAS